MRRRDVLKAAVVAAVSVSSPRAANKASPGSGKLALALGSGSHHGHALIGAMRVFERHGVRPDLIVGTSVGAMVGALWASGMDSATIRKAADRFSLWRNARFTWPTRGLFSNRGLQETMRGLLPSRAIESWPIRFAAVASDLATGERVLIERGDGAAAVAASAAMPVLCKPVSFGGRLLVDGALTEPVPMKAARELGAARVVGIDIAYRPSDAPVDSVADSGFQAMHIMVNALIAEHARHADVLIRLGLHPLMEGRKQYREVLAKAGEEAVEAMWGKIVA